VVRTDASDAHKPDGTVANTWIDCPHVRIKVYKPGASRMPEVAKNFLLLAALALIAIYLAHRFPEMEKGTDFPDFYAAAKLVHDGLGHQLYDPAVQERFQIRYSGRIGTLYIHPAFEALFYLPFAAAPPHRAYVLWSLLNLALLIVISVAVCGPGFLIAYPRFLLALPSLPFSGIHPRQMANLRGLSALLIPGLTSASLALTIAASFLLLSMAVRGSILARTRPQATALLFASSVLTSLLVGYHLSPHDLSLLLVPMTMISTYVLATHHIPKWLRMILV